MAGVDPLMKGNASLDTNKLSVHDAYRFRAIVEEAVERLDLLEIVNEKGRRRDNQDKQGGNRKDVYHLMVNQKELEEKYENLMQKRSQLRGLSNKSKYVQNQAELTEVSAALRESTVNIVQNLKDHPTVVSNIQKIQKDRGELAGLLADTVDDLKLDHFNSLVAQVNYRLEQQRLLWETQLAHEKTREALKNLETELRAERESFNHGIEDKNIEIHSLTAELKHLKKVTALTLKYEKETALANQETVKRMNRRELAEVRKKTTKVTEGVERDTLVHDDTIAFLTKQQDNLQHLHDQWDAKHKKDFDELTGELEELEEHRDSDRKKLTTVQARWEADKAEKSAKKMEKEQRLIEAENKKKLVKIMNLAQAKIFFFWRVYNRKRPKKKGKGGKKGSKKKKKK